MPSRSSSPTNSSSRKRSRSGGGSPSRANAQRARAAGGPPVGYIAHPKLRNILSQVDLKNKIAEHLSPTRRGQAISALYNAYQYAPGKELPYRVQKSIPFLSRRTSGKGQPGLLTPEALQYRSSQRLKKVVEEAVRKVLPRGRKNRETRSFYTRNRIGGFTNSDSSAHHGTGNNSNHPYYRYFPASSTRQRHVTFVPELSNNGGPSTPALVVDPLRRVNDVHGKLRKTLRNAGYILEHPNSPGRNPNRYYPNDHLALMKIRLQLHPHEWELSYRTMRLRRNNAATNAELQTKLRRRAVRLFGKNNVQVNINRGTRLLKLTFPTAVSLSAATRHGFDLGRMMLLQLGKSRHEFDYRIVRGGGGFVHEINITPTKTLANKMSP